MNNKTSLRIIYAIYMYFGNLHNENKCILYRVFSYFLYRAIFCYSMIKFQSECVTHKNNNDIQLKRRKKERKLQTL